MRGLRVQILPGAQKGLFFYFQNGKMKMNYVNTRGKGKNNKKISASSL